MRESEKRKKKKKDKSYPYWKEEAKLSLCLKFLKNHLYGDGMGAGTKGKRLTVS